MSIRLLRLPFRMEHSETVMHAGVVTQTGQVVATPRGNTKAVYMLDDPSEDEAAARREKAAAIMGLPFIELTHISPFKLFPIPSGGSVRRDALEMVYNDSIVIDRVCGEGYYAKIMRPDVEVEILGVARALFTESVQ